MVRKGHVFDRSFGLALCLAALPLAQAGDGTRAPPSAAAAPMEIPHTTDLVLADMARRKNRRIGNIENLNFLGITPGLTPLVWPKNTDMRARLLTPQLRSTPVVGWIAENLYRSKKDNGWCLELDPGGGEYVVFYRLNLK